MRESVKTLEIIADSLQVETIKRDLECKLAAIADKQIQDAQEDIAEALFKSLDSFSIMNKESIKKAIDMGRLSKCRSGDMELYLLDSEIPLVKVTYHEPNLSEEKVKTKVTITTYING